MRKFKQRKVNLLKVYVNDKMSPQTPAMNYSGLEEINFFLPITLLWKYIILLLLENKD